MVVTKSGRWWAAHWEVAGEGCKVEASTPAIFEERPAENTETSFKEMSPTLKQAGDADAMAGTVYTTNLLANAIEWNAVAVLRKSPHHVLRRTVRPLVPAHDSNN